MSKPSLMVVPSLLYMWLFVECTCEWFPTFVSCLVWTNKKKKKKKKKKDIHPAHVVYTVLGHIQPVIHKLCTFIHQTYTLYMSYTRYWAIFNRWYITCTLLYIRYASCTCRLCGIGPYTNGETWPLHIYTSDIHPVLVVYEVLGHIQPVIHSLYTFIHQT